MAAKSKTKRAGKGASLADYPLQGTGTAAVDRKAQRRYAAEDALRTLTRAEEHRSNPRLMSDVKKLAAEHATKMARIAKR